MPVATPYADTNLMRRKISSALAPLPAGLRTSDAVELLLSTAAQESRFGKFSDRSGSGGLGVFQVNPKTEDWIWGDYLKKRPRLAEAITRSTGVVGPSSTALSENFPYAAIMSRLTYASYPEALPSRKDPVAQANYWKKWYNTVEGKGTPEDFLRTYYEMIGGRK